MAKKRTGAPDAENEFQVTLKPLFGIAPERYLPVFYGILLLVILFFILVFPGLRNYGSVLHVATLPEGASVYVDGVREGATPLAVFVPAGTHDLTLKRPHFADATEKIDVKGKLFATLIWPRHEEVNRTLSLGDAKRRRYGGWFPRRPPRRHGPRCRDRGRLGHHRTCRRVGSSTLHLRMPLLLRDVHGYPSRELRDPSVVRHSVPNLDL